MVYVIAGVKLNIYHDTRIAFSRSSIFPMRAGWWLSVLPRLTDLAYEDVVSQQCGTRKALYPGSVLLETLDPKAYYASV
jgi:hypothetical protein